MLPAQNSNVLIQQPNPIAHRVRVCTDAVVCKRCRLSYPLYPLFDLQKRELYESDAS